VEHYLLPTTDGSQARLRRRAQDGTSHFNLTVRQPPPFTDIETRRSLTGREFDILRSQVDTNTDPIIKRRRCFLWNQRYFQLDVFEQPARVAGLAILEAYFAHPETANDRQGAFVVLDWWC
jgi:hypothetical protein